MPRSKCGKKRPPVDIISLKEAVEDVKKNGSKISAAARNHNISKSTLLRHLKTYESTSGEFKYISNIAVKRIFDDTEESLLEGYLKKAAKLHYGLSRNELRALAFQFAATNKKEVPENWSEKKAGKEWFRGFLQRHKDLSLRKPEATSLSRATSFNKTNVSAFFTNLKDCLMRFKITPERIFNLDETGNSTVHVPPKIIAEKGEKQVGSMTSGERGINVTMISAINAIGNHVPPMLIFPRVHFRDFMIKGAPVGTIGGANPSGWSNGDLFHRYLEHFISHVKPDLNNKVLLILDNHESHISIKSIDEAKKNGIVLLTLPPHTSHKLQPLDRTVFGPYKTFYNQAVNEWMACNPGKPFSIYDVPEIIGKAYPRAFTGHNIMKGFEVTGIWPLDENIFTEDEFLCSHVTDRPLNINTTSDNLQELNENNPNLVNSEAVNAQVEAVNAQLKAFVSPEIIRPFPKAGPRKIKREPSRKKRQDQDFNRYP